MNLIIFLLQIGFALNIVSTSNVFMISVPEEDPIVLTTLGYVKGTIMTARDNGTFYAFRGIPYAKPPIGDLRFKNPVVADSWTGVYDATNDSFACPQYAPGFEEQCSEDCLFVNVYSKRLPSMTYPGNSSTLPVLVWIHGGGFVGGGAVSYLYRPQLIMERDVVLVTVAYRLGPLGFLSTGDSSAYGNAGMLDQVMALKWVQDNIAAFGGDPQRVAIDGESAGGASVSFHLLSPLSKGLFQAAICQSGSSLSPWPLHKKPLQWAISLGQQFNCSGQNTSLLVECLRQQSADDIVNAVAERRQNDVLFLPFVPVVETPHDGAFLQEEPLKILQEGRFTKVPVISGINKDEGLLIYNSFLDVFNSTYDIIFQYILQEVVTILLHDYDDNLENVTAAVKQEYFNGVDFNNQSAAIRAAIDMSSDSYFKAGNDMAVRLLAAGGATVYMYEFAFAGSASKSNLTGEIEINHGADVNYLFNFLPNMTEADMRTSNALIDMWINFADQHNPTPDGSEVEWTPSPNGTIRYLRIGDNLTMEENYLTDRMHFWNVVVPEIINNSKCV